MEYFAISRAMRAISASRCVSSPLRPITPTLISSSTKRISVSKVSASSSRVYVLFEDPREVPRRVTRAEPAAAFDALLYDLEREILLVLQRKDVPEELDILGREEPVAARAAEVDQTPAFQVADLADREGRELGPQTLDDLADGETVLGGAVPLLRRRVTFGGVVPLISLSIPSFCTLLTPILSTTVPHALGKHEPETVLAYLYLVSVAQIDGVDPDAVYVCPVQAPHIAYPVPAISVHDLRVFA